MFCLTTARTILLVADSFSLSFYFVFCSSIQFVILFVLTYTGILHIHYLSVMCGELSWVECRVWGTKGHKLCWEATMKWIALKIKKRHVIVMKKKTEREWEWKCSERCNRVQWKRYKRERRESFKSEKIGVQRENKRNHVKYVQ